MREPLPAFRLDALDHALEVELFCKNYICGLYVCVFFVLFTLPMFIDLLRSFTFKLLVCQG